MLPSRRLHAVSQPTKAIAGILTFARLDIFPAVL
jgi:hypothetical protein